MLNSNHFENSYSGSNIGKKRLEQKVGSGTASNNGGSIKKKKKKKNKVKTRNI